MSSRKEKTAMKRIVAAVIAGGLTLSVVACNTPGERALGGAALGGLAGAAIGGAVTGHGTGALTGAAIGAAGGAIVGAATTPEPVEPMYAAPAGSSMQNPRMEKAVRPHKKPTGCYNGTYVEPSGQIACSP
jgi:osmotically inducible lipoprotein OsmB